MISITTSLLSMVKSDAIASRLEVVGKETFPNNGGHNEEVGKENSYHHVQLHRLQSSVNTY